MSWGTFLAQIDASVPGGWMSVVFGYGPLGVACVWLARLVETMRKELAGRDALVREITDKQVKAIGQASHQIQSLSRALVYNAATHGPARVQEMAQKEMTRWSFTDDPQKSG